MPDGDDVVLLERRGAVAVVTLNRPAKRNPIGRAMRAALVGILDALEADAACRAIVLTGAGGHFCAGGDLSDLPAGSAAAMHTRMRHAHALLLRILHSRKPYVAAVEGSAFGAGLSLALACDHVVASPGAKFCAPFVRVGLAPDVGLLWTLPRRVGFGRAQDITLGAEPVGGEEAVRIGLADRLAADEGALETAVRRAEVFAAGAPGAIAFTKAGLLHAGGPLAATLEWEALAQTVLLRTDDHAEGRQAFLERRPPVFRDA